jgi:hypothetical protein
MGSPYEVSVPTQVTEAESPFHSVQGVYGLFQQYMHQSSRGHMYSRRPIPPQWHLQFWALQGGCCSATPNVCLSGQPANHPWNRTFAWSKTTRRFCGSCRNAIGTLSAQPSTKTLIQSALVASTMYASTWMGLSASPLQGQTWLFTGTATAVNASKVFNHA